MHQFSAIRMLTILEIIQKTTDFFSSKGIESARLNAETLVGHALGLKRMQLYLQFERPLRAEELDLVRPLVRRRSQREPLQHILGTVEWGGLILKCDRRALIPRHETEYLIELIVARVSTEPATVLDLGTGSGALACVLATRYKQAHVTAVDLSAEALALAAENVEALKLSARVNLVTSDWFAALPPGETFDLIVANPPYLSEEETTAAEPEVKLFEPESALIAAEEGLADLRRIVAESATRLNPGGWLALETGITHHATLLELLPGVGLAEGESVPDLTGRDRFIFARRR